jgi:hypothetical protein
MILDVDVEPSLTLKRLNFFTVLYKNSVCTSKETHHVSPTEKNKKILFFISLPKGKKYVR